LKDIQRVFEPVLPFGLVYAQSNNNRTVDRYEFWLRERKLLALTAAGELILKIKPIMRTDFLAAVFSCPRSVPGNGYLPGHEALQCRK